ncbi:MAG: diguanylate cyclase [Ideonella sp.]|nr:diguanylate cyclase [Ideonella sp.]
MKPNTIDRMKKAPQRTAQFTARWRWLAFGVRAEDTATQVRKIVQVNAGVWLMIGTILVFNALFWLVGNEALIRSGLWQLPLMLVVPAVWWLNARRHLRAGRWLMLLLAMTDCFVAIAGGQGTASSVHIYFLLLAVMTPTFFPVEEWPSTMALVMANLLIFLVLQFGYWPPHPSFALLDAQTREQMIQSMVVSCVLILILMTMLTEIAAADNENRLIRLAETDPLTGLANRRQFRQALEAEGSRMAREGGSFVLGVFDLDHFKRVNDEWGHDAGDQALVHIGQVVQGQLRAYDLVARTGGEEFVLLLPHTDLVEASVVVGRIRQALVNDPFTYGGHARVITVSIGLALVIDQATMDQRLRQADEAMYQAKHEGRNRVCCAP